MKLLAIDTVFDKCGVAIIADGEMLHHAEQTGKRQQTQQILPMIDDALQATDLKLSEISALVFNRGPGAFSGIRINTAVIQALSFAHDIPCVAVSSLQVLAQAGHEMYGANDCVEQCYAVLDARMKQVYLGEYQVIDGIMQLVGDEALLDYEKSTANNAPLFCLETDDKDLLVLDKNQSSYQDIEPNAKTLARLGEYLFAQNGGISAEQALPVYLRNNAWKTLKEQGKG